MLVSWSLAMLWVYLFVCLFLVRFLYSLDCYIHFVAKDERMTLKLCSSCLYYWVLGLQECPAMPGLYSTGDQTQGILHTRPVLYQLSYIISFCLRQGLTLYTRLTSNSNLLPLPPQCWDYEHVPIAFFWLWFWVFSFHSWWLYLAQAVRASWKS